MLIWNLITNRLDYSQLWWHCSLHEVIFQASSGGDRDCFLAHGGVEQGSEMRHEKRREGAGLGWSEAEAEAGGLSRVLSVWGATAQQERQPGAQRSSRRKRASPPLRSTGPLSVSCTPWRCNNICPQRWEPQSRGEPAALRLLSFSF